MIVQMVVKNDLGEFKSEKMEVTSEQYLGIVEVSKKFYAEESGFEMWIDDGFLVIPPEINKRSILIINILEYDKEENKKNEEH